MCPLLLPNNTLGWVRGTYSESQVPRLWGWNVCPPPSIPLLLPLQIPCSLVIAKLITPPPPSLTRLREIKKRAPVPGATAMLGLCYWVGVNKKVLNTGEPMSTNCFFVFPAFIFSSFKTLNPPPHKGPAVFLNIGLTQTCIAIALPPPPPPKQKQKQTNKQTKTTTTWEPYQSTKRTTMKRASK